MRALPLVLSVCAGLALAGAADRASQLARDARKAESAGNHARAYMLWAQAAALDPNQPDYWTRSQALRHRAIHVDTGAGAAIDDSSDAITDDELRQAREPLPPKELKGQPGRRRIDSSGDPRRVFEEIAKLFGLDVVFDGDYPPASSGPPVRIRIDSADYREALRALEAATSSFLVPIGERLFMVFKETPTKRQEAEPTVAVMVPIPTPVTIQEAQELARGVQQAMEIQRFAVDNTRRMALIRDRVSKVRPAQALFEDLMRHKAQVVVEIEFLDVSSSRSRSYGLNLQTSTILSVLGASRLSLGGGPLSLGLAILDSQLIASMNESQARTLLKAEIRALDGQAATFHVGDRFPVLTSGYFGDTSGGTDELFRPPPSFTFEDLGLSVKVTPRVHAWDDVTIEIESEFKVLAGSSVNDIPVISNKKFISRIRVRAGEWVILAGLVNANEARTISGLAGLSSLPLLGPLLRNNSRFLDDSEALILLKPRVVSLPPADTPTRAYWVGTETRPRIGM